MAKSKKTPAMEKLPKTSMTVLRLVSRYPDFIPEALWLRARKARIRISEETVEEQLNFLDGKGLIARGPGLSIFAMSFRVTKRGETSLCTGLVSKHARKTKTQRVVETQRPVW